MQFNPISKHFWTKFQPVGQVHELSSVHMGPFYVVSCSILD